MRFGANDVKKLQGIPWQIGGFLLLQMHMCSAGVFPEFLDIDSSMKDDSI
jgi:hypothetical protein